MKTVFADTGYWIALLDPQDTLNPNAIQCSMNLAQATICTSEMVLTEFLNHFAKRGEFLRRAAVNFVQSLQQNPAMAIAPQTSELYQQALLLYAQRIDQAWSHTDCASFCIMRDRGITEAFAYDKHFEQAGFVALLR
jgi:predicted nucleic acid-binding protein